MVEIWKPGDPMPQDVDRFTFFNWVTPTIAICGYDAACDRKVLDIERVEHIISIGELSPSEAVVGRTPVRFRNIKDGTTDVRERDITSCVDAIRTWSRAGRTLVHCAAGVSRSPGFVALALCIDNGWDWEESIRYVTERRKLALVHPLLESRLREWLKGFRARARS